MVNFVLRELAYIPYVLGLLLVTGLLVAWYFYRYIQRSTDLRTHGKVGRTALLVKIGLRAMLVIVSACSVGVAILRPCWGKNETICEQRGRNVLIALDVSRSMLAQDAKPSRLSCAKEKIIKLVHLLDSDRVSLMLFSGMPFVSCPFTSDRQTFISFLNSVTVEALSSGTTALDQALQEAVKQYEEVGVTGSKIVVMLTDGEDFSDDLSRVQDRIAREGVSVVTLGIGSEQGAPIPLFDHNGKQVGVQQDQEKVVISRLNGNLLKRLAKATGGLYQAVTDDDTDLYNVQAFVEQFESSDLGSVRRDGLKERYWLFALFAALLLLVEWIL